MLQLRPVDVALAMRSQNAAHIIIIYRMLPIERAGRIMSKRKVLFLCTHNSARSQMAEGLLRALKGEAYEVFSAGVSPTQVDPDAIKAMAEIMDIRFDIIVTVCDSAREACPFFPGPES